MLAPAVPGVCAEPECTSTRVHPQCGHLMCRKHCWVSGGCDAKGHNAPVPAGEVQHLHPPPEATPTLSVANPTILVPPPVIDPALLISGTIRRPPPPVIDPDLCISDTILRPPPPVIDPTLIDTALSSSSQVPIAGPSTLPTPSQVTTRKGKGRATVPAPDADFYSNPRLPSQLPPVFTDAYAKQEAERLRKYEAQSLERELALTAQNTVTAFGWVAVCFFLL